MRKPAKRAINVPATPAKKPVLKPDTKPAVLAPLPASKPVTAPIGKTVSNKAATTVAQIANDAGANLPRGLIHDAAGIVRYATNFNQYSSRDDAYLAFFGNVMRVNSGSATLRQIHDAGITRSGMPDRKRYNPNYTGSGKATDVGAINRLCKAGYISRSADGNTLTATKLALASKAYNGGK